MKKQLFLLIIAFTFSLSTVRAQYLGYSQLLFPANDTVKLFASAEFGFGTFNCCPPLNSFQSQITGDTMHVKLFYQSIWCVTDFCETDSIIYLGQVIQNTLKAVKLHPYTVGVISSPPPIWDTAYYPQYEKILLFPWTGIDTLTPQYFSISPNPAHNEFTIEYTYSGEAILTELTGRFIGKYSLPAGKNKETINISHLATGVYLVQFKSWDGRVNMQKLLKN